MLKIDNDVLIGDDDYLFLWQGRQKQFSYLTGDLRPSDESISNFKDNFEKRSAFCKKNNVEYFHLVFPSKPLIKNKFLPDSLKSVKSLYEQHYKECGIIYPISELMDKEEQQSTFRILDTHMTDIGSLCVMETLFSSYFDKLYQSGAFFNRQEKKVTGDLAKMLGLSNQYTEIFLQPRDCLGDPFISRYFNNFSELKGNGGGVSITFTPSAFYEKRVLIFGDSFFLSALPLIRCLFSEIMFIRSEVFKSEIVHLYKPDIVITSNAERYLAKVKSDNIATFLFFDDLLKDHYKMKPSSDFVTALQAALSVKYDRLLNKRFNNNIVASVLNEEFRNLSASNRFFYAENKLEEILKLKPRNIKFLKRYEDLQAGKMLPCISKISLSNIQRFATYFFKLNLRKDCASLSFKLDNEDFSYTRITNIFLENIVYIMNSFEPDERICKIVFSMLAKLSVLFEDATVLKEVLEPYSHADVNRLYTLLKSAYFLKSAAMVFNFSKQSYFKKSDNCFEGFLSSYLSYLDLGNKDATLLGEFPGIKYNYPCGTDHDFYEYISGKSVAIVGPAPTRNNYGDEIDNFDVVVRLSFESPEKSIPDPVRIGYKTNISYYSAHLRFFKDDASDIVEGLDFVCVSMPKYMPEILTYSNVRQVEIPDVCFIGKPNLIQTCVLDLLKLNPSRIKVFCCNLFASEVAYSNSYPSTNMLNIVSGGKVHRGLNSTTFTNHDPINNFLILKILCDNKKIQCDPELESVLEMSFEEYMGVLDSIYS